ncbi:MAG: heme-binding protein, partial [Candidatus Thiodiazotropha sp. (ex Notomyrtea botanica)]|nr:heme-binding protein [Candidatus Thiodiazotropha sp. (ex Notomyrtea botanica)]
MLNQYLTPAFMFLIMLFTVSQVCLAEDSVLQSSRSLSVEYANKAAWTALIGCRKKGYSVAVAVVDRGGNLQAFL